MGTLILILLILAALTGVFWTVLKVTAIAILTLVLTIMVLVWIGVWYAKRRWNRLVNDPNVQRARRQFDPSAPRGPGAGGGGRRPGQAGVGPIEAQGRKEPDGPLP